MTRAPACSALARLASIAVFVAFALVAAAGCNRSRGGEWIEAPSPRYGEGSRSVIGTDGTPEDPDAAIRPRSRASVGCSRVVGLVGVQGGLATLVATALFFAWMHRLRSRSQRAFDPRAALANGASVLFGVVEAETDQDRPVISVRIQQRGREWQNKGAWSHQWAETEREVTVRPFYLRRDDGQRVRIEPDLAVALHDALSRTLRVATSVRTRTAELTVGERVHIAGTVFGVGRSIGGGAYRETMTEPVMRAPRTGRMVVSTEPPGDTEASRTRFHFGWAAGLLTALMASVALMLSFDAIVVDGRTVIATPTHTRFWETWVQPKNGRGYWSPHWAVRASAPWGEGRTISVEDDCSERVWSCASAGECDVPFVVAEHAPGYQLIGTAPSVNSGLLVLCMIGASILGLGYWASAMQTRPWYQKRKVVEGGGGRL